MNVRKYQLCLITSAMNQDLMTNSLNDSFKSSSPFLNTSVKILHQKMHIGVVDLIAQRE